MAEDNYLWLVKYCTPWEMNKSGEGVEAFKDGVIPVIARNQYEAIGKAMTVPGIETTIVDPASIKAERLYLLHEEDKRYNIKVEELSDIVKS